MKIRFFPFIIFLFFGFFIYGSSEFSVYANDCVNGARYSYLTSGGINKDFLFFDNVQSYCFICWGEGEDDPWTGRQSHNILYINDPDFRVKTRLASIEKDKAIIFSIRFYKFRNEEIVNRKIMLPDDRFSFYANLANKDKKENDDHGDSIVKLDIKSGYIKLKSLGGMRGSEDKTVGNFLIHLSSNESIEGGFMVEPRVREYGP